MIITYNNKKTEDEILKKEEKYFLPNFSENTNKLFYGDNFYIMKALLHQYNMKGQVDLIYIDPPFSTNTVFRADVDRAQTISMGNNSDIAYYDTLIGDEFIEFIRERLVLAKELLSDIGSIYLHIDYKVGHYIKLIMDEIFGADNFRNDITRIKCNPKNFKRKAYGNIKDLILFYSKTKNNIWNECYTQYSQDDINKLYKKVKDGRNYTTVPLHAPGETLNGVTSQAFKGMLPPKGRHWRCSPEELEKLDQQGLIEWSSTGVPRRIIYADEKLGKKVQDIWDYKDPQYPEYPTEKNINLLKQIIKTSSNENSLVMDFFCGSGTTLLAAEQLSRRWIGIDNSEKAIEIALKKLDAEKNMYSLPRELVNCTDKKLKKVA